MRNLISQTPSPSSTFFDAVRGIISDVLSADPVQQKERVKRKELRRMLKLDGRELADMGVTREDVVEALNISLDKNSGYHLTRLQRRRIS